MKVLIIREDGCMPTCAIVNGDEAAVRRIEDGADRAGLTFTLITADSLADVEKYVSECAKEAAEA